MGEKLKDERIQFAKAWEIKREIGPCKYILRGICGFGVLFFGIVLIDYFLRDSGVYVYQIVIDVVLAILLPIISWLINEIRYKKIKEKYQ